MTKTATAQRWRNRIVGHGEMPASEFLTNPLNWRIHPQFQQEAMAGALNEIGWIDEVTVNTRTGRIVDGHLRVTLALREGDKTPVPYKEVDLSEQQLLDQVAQVGALPDAEEWGASLGELPDGDRAPFQQMTFTLSDEQAEQVKAALDHARRLGPFVDTGNENGNGNALARVCEVFCGTR